MRCRHAFETVCIHANGDVVCSIIDGRGDFVLGNANDQPISEIFRGERYRRLRELVLSTTDTYCPAIGKHCPLKMEPVVPGETVAADVIRFLQIEPTTACDLRCLSCPVRDFDRHITWRDAYRDGGAAFLAWDGARRMKQHTADLVRRALPVVQALEPPDLGRAGASLLRGRIPRRRNGVLSLDTLEKIIDAAGSHVERVDFYNYGEPFLYRHLAQALRYIRRRLPSTTIAISTDGMLVTPQIEDTVIREGLLDWLVFSIDGCDAESYARYRIRGDFDVAMANLYRVHAKARATSLRVIWQYVVFRWNDADDQLRRAIELSEEAGITLWFDFARSTWGRSRRKASDLPYIVPYLRPETGLPNW